MLSVILLSGCELFGEEKTQKVQTAKDKAKEALDDGVLYTFGFSPPIIINGYMYSELKSRDCYNSKDIDHAFGQIDENNFVNIGYFGNKANRDRGNKGLSCKDFYDEMQKLKVKNGYKLDGGSSTVYFYKSNKAALYGPGPSYDGRRGGNILYFVEQN